MFGKINVLTEYTDDELRQLEEVKHKNGVERGNMLLRYEMAGFTITPEELQDVDMYYNTQLQTDIERKKLWLSFDRAERKCSLNEINKITSLKKKYDKQRAQLVKEFDRVHDNDSFNKTVQRITQIGKKYVDSIPFATAAHNSPEREELCRREEEVFFKVCGYHTIDYNLAEAEAHMTPEELERIDKESQEYYDREQIKLDAMQKELEANAAAHPMRIKYK